MSHYEIDKLSLEGVFFTMGILTPLIVSKTFLSITKKLEETTWKASCTFKAQDVPFLAIWEVILETYFVFYVTMDSHTRLSVTN